MRAHHYALAAVVLFVAAVLSVVLLSGDPESLPRHSAATAAGGSDPAPGEAIPPAAGRASLPTRAGDETPRAAEARDGTHVHGTVRNDSGRSVAGVRIIPPGASGEVVPNYYSDSNGRFEFWLSPFGERPSYPVSFRAEGYEPMELLLAEKELRAAEVQKDVELVRMGARAEVSGTLLNTRGEAVAGIQVQFYSKSLGERYHASSDRFGEFVLPEVRPGSDYELLIQPEADYQDYIERKILVPSTGLKLDLVLDPLAAGRLVGRLVDPEGNAIPDMRITVRSDRLVRSPLQASSDASGRFVLDGVPAGRLTFSADAGPKLMVRGVRLDPGEEREVVLVLDWGANSIAGRVVDDHGDPVPGAQVALSWMIQDGPVRSSSNRTATTGSDGSFRFEKLGSGPHRIEATAPGHDSASGEYQVGSTAELRLPRQDS